MEKHVSNHQPFLGFNGIYLNIIGNCWSNELTRKREYVDSEMYNKYETDTDIDHQ